MNAANQRQAQKLIAIIVIVALLGVIGFSPAIIVFLLVAGVLIWRKVRRSEYLETARVFEFYISADEVMREDGRHWYGFEIAEIIEAGEKVIFSLPDPPPLIRFTLGALYHRIGEFEVAIEQLSKVVEDKRADELHLTTPSPQLRRYVETVRRIERDPAEAPQTLAAVRNLERLRRRGAADLLADSRERLQEEPLRRGELKKSVEQAKYEPANLKPLSLITAPPPISEVLRDVYQPEDKKTA